MFILKNEYLIINYKIFNIYYKMIGPQGTYIIVNNNRINTLNDDKDDDNIDKTIWDKIEHLKSFPQYEQKSKEWLIQRRERIGGSESAACLGCNHYEPQYNFIRKKVKRVPFETTEIIWWGNATEDVARELYEYLYNVQVEEYGSLPHEKYNFIAASPDGIVGKYKRNGKNLTNMCGRMVEIKSVSKRKINMDPLNTIITEIVPEYYLTQVYQQLETCDLEECDFFQIKAYRYTTYNEFKNDFENQINDHKFRGMIIQLRPNDFDGEQTEQLENCKFIQMPKIDMTLKEQINWYKEKKKEYNDYINDESPDKKINKLYEDYYFDTVLYYRIDEARCTLVKRNKELFESYIPTYKKMWDYVLYLREHSDKTEQFINYINSKEKRNKYGYITKFEETNKKIMEYLDKLVNDQLND